MRLKKKEKKSKKKPFIVSSSLEGKVFIRFSKALITDLRAPYPLVELISVSASVQRLL